MKKDEFKIKAYGWKELGCLYSPELTAEAAGRRLKNWVRWNNQLWERLTTLGLKDTQRVLTPMMVEAITKHLGPP